jgi:diguanylate cyclase (GGDEF)-like protein
MDTEADRDDLAAKVCASDSLPAMPAVALAIMARCRDHDVDFGELASLVSSDPSLAARLLRLANSCAFAGRTDVTSVQNALTRLGLRLTQATVLGFALVTETKGPAGLDTGAFWRFALTTSQAARVLAQVTKAEDPDDAFAAGLLQDVGVLAFACALPDRYPLIVARHYREAVPLDELERAELGVDHAEVGARLLRGWGLPEAIHEPIRHQVDINAVDDAELPRKVAALARILWLANGVGQVFNGPDGNVAYERVLRGCGLYFGLTGPDVQHALQQIRTAVDDTAAAFSVDVHSVPSYADVRASSLHRVIELAAGIEAGYRDYRDKAEEAREALVELEAKHREVARRAAYDELTGVLARGEFMRRFEIELAEAVRSGRPLGVVFLDVDRFKSVNDSLGHAAGDALLRAFAECLGTALRRSDLIGRYGGDEFAVVLPDTDFEAATAVAGRLRAAVAEESGGWQSGSDGVTTSVGLVHTACPDETADAAKLLEEADRCLYAAKADGRNCVRCKRL